MKQFTLLDKFKSKKFLSYKNNDEYNFHFIFYIVHIVHINKFILFLLVQFFL